MNIGGEITAGEQPEIGDFEAPYVAQKTDWDAF